MMNYSIAWSTIVGMSIRIQHGLYILLCRDVVKTSCSTIIFLIIVI